MTTDPQVQVDYEPLELPEGVRHLNLSGVAETRLAYDALTSERGWREESHAGSGLAWKVIEVDSRKMTVLPPRPIPGLDVQIDTSGDFGEPDRDEDRPF